MKKVGLLSVITGIIMQFFLAGCNNNGGNTLTVSDSLRKEAIGVLRLNLENQSKWEKVHAAEYLLSLGYPQQIKQTFQNEELKFGKDSSYRIGVWRVLAQADTAIAEKRVWINKIIDAYQDPNGLDRVEAAEALAKLRISPLKENPGVTQEILEKKSSPLSIYTLWGISVSESDSSKGRNFFLNLLVNDSADILSKRIAGNALRYLNNLSTKEWHLLAQSALSDSEKLEETISLLSTAFVTAPKDSVQSVTYINIRSKLLEVKDSPNDCILLDMTSALSEKGTLEDLPLLISLMEGNRQRDTVEIVDLRMPDLQSAAAYAILKIERRVEHSGLMWLDWGVLIAYLLGMFGIGFYYYHKNKNENDFFLGGGKMNPLTVGLSLFATFTSAISYLAAPGEMIKYGPVFFIGIIAFPIIYWVVGWFIIPKLKKFNVTSGYEILEIKLGISVRILATIFFLGLRFLWMATIVYVSVNIVIFPIFKIDPSYSIVVGGLLMVITIIYTSLGGLKAVVLTDAIQALVMLAGAIIVLILVSMHFGSFTSWVPRQWLDQWGEMEIKINIRDRSSIGAVVLMTFIWYVASSLSDQMSIQRFLATENVKLARRTFGISLWANVIGLVLLGLVGLALFAYFTANPQYLSSSDELNIHADLLFPKYIMIGLPAGVSGLLIAAVLAASMSSLSSGINSCASVITEDIIKRFRPREKDPYNELKHIQKLSLLIGLIALLLSFVIPYVKGNLIDISIKVVNLLVSPLGVLFFLALYVPFATSRGTFIGGIVSLVIAVAVAFFGFLDLNVFFISVTSLVVGIVVGVLCSFVDNKILGNQNTASKRS